MQVKRIGIAVAILAGGLVVARPWAHADGIGVFEWAAQDSQTDTGSRSANRFDPTVQGRRAGSFDPYAQGIGNPVIDLIWIQGNT